jgi:hypothetical protein
MEEKLQLMKVMVIKMYEYLNKSGLCRSRVLAKNSIMILPAHAANVSIVSEIKYGEL